jgi:hypothetical protein
VRDVYLANVTKGKNPCKNCPVPGLNVTYTDGFDCEEVSVEQTIASCALVPRITKGTTIVLTVGETE